MRKLLPLLLLLVATPVVAQDIGVDMTARNLTVTSSCNFAGASGCGGNPAPNSVDLAFSFSQIPSAPASYRHQIVMDQSLTIPANFSSGGGANASTMSCVDAATSDTTFYIDYITYNPFLNHVLGWVTVSSGQYQGVFSVSSQTTLAAGTLLHIATPPTQDATLDDCGITIGAHR